MSPTITTPYKYVGVASIALLKLVFTPRVFAQAITFTTNENFVRRMHEGDTIQPPLHGDHLSFIINIPNQYVLHSVIIHR
jgi:hypothetical protein